MRFTVAIVGRPNVGKSTLFNRLTGKKQAIVDDMPGVTRDRRYGSASLAGLEFAVIDTAGMEEAGEGTLQARMTQQTHAAVEEADVALMVVDARAGITPIDQHFASLLRRSRTPVVLVVNKVEGGKLATAGAAEAYELGLGEPVLISAEHGQGMLELRAALAEFAPDEPEEGEEMQEAEDAPPPVMQIAIVGRPNVGKSTLMNRILGEERVLTGPEAGITRDSIAIDHMFEGKPLKLIDTAGMRRRANVTERLEKMAVGDSLESLRYAHVAVLVLDAEQPLEKQDNTIAAFIEREGRAMVVAVNKWDAVTDRQAYLKAIHQRLEMVLAQVKGIPVVPISAQTGEGVHKLLKECFRVYQIWNRKIGTGELNRWLELALEEHAPPLVGGRRIKIRYMTQKSARPPSFLLFSNTDDIPEHYLRYLVGRLREAFALPGVPIRLTIRKNKNPYDASRQER